MDDGHAPQQPWLEAFVAEHGGIAGTVHVAREGDLHLTARHNIPEQVAAVVAHVPRGKGMAGMAQVSRAPVQTCNLQRDETGSVRPGARAVAAQAAIALPVFDGDGEVRAVVGIAWAGERPIGSTEEEALLQSAATVPAET
jgi:L-methionine (R)-S-oxide reductase